MSWTLQDERRGFGVALSREGLERVSRLRRSQRRPDSGETPGSRFPSPGKDGEGIGGHEQGFGAGVGAGHGLHRGTRAGRPAVTGGGPSRQGLEA